MIPFKVIKPAIKLVLSAVKNADEAIGPGQGKDKRAAALEEILANGYDLGDAVADVFVDGGLPEDVDKWVKEEFLHDSIEAALEFFNDFNGKKVVESAFENAAEFIGFKLKHVQNPDQEKSDDPTGN